MNDNKEVTYKPEPELKENEGWLEKNLLNERKIDYSALNRAQERRRKTRRINRSQHTNDKKTTKGEAPAALYEHTRR